MWCISRSVVWCELGRQSTIKVSTCQGDKAASVESSGDYICVCMAFVSVHSGVVILERRREWSSLQTVPLFFRGKEFVLCNVCIFVVLVAYDIFVLSFLMCIMCLLRCFGCLWCICISIFFSTMYLFYYFFEWCICIFVAFCCV